MIDQITQAVQANALHTIEATGYVTAALALLQYYTGIGPKALPGRWSAVPALVLTCCVLGVYAWEAGYSWPLVVAVALINGAVAGAGSNLVHSSAQAVSRKVSPRAPGKFACVVGRVSSLDVNGVVSLEVEPREVGRLGSGSVGKAAKIVLASMALLALSGCQQVKAASDYVDGLCQGIMSVQPAVQAEAARRTAEQGRKVTPIEIAGLICALNDLGREVANWFMVPAPDNSRLLMAAPPETLEKAKDRALFVATRRGVLR